jgi:hypothetical protein
LRLKDYVEQKGKLDKGGSAGWTDSDCLTLVILTYNYPRPHDFTLFHNVALAPQKPLVSEPPALVRLRQIVVKTLALKK